MALIGKCQSVTSSHTYFPSTQLLVTDAAEPFRFTCFQIHSFYFNFWRIFESLCCTASAVSSTAIYREIDRLTCEKKWLHNDCTTGGRTQLKLVFIPFVCCDCMSLLFRERERWNDVQWDNGESKDIDQRNLTKWLEIWYTDIFCFPVGFHLLNLRKVKTEILIEQHW